MQDLADRIKHLRISLRMSQREMSRALGGDRAATVSAWEAGKEPRAPTILALAALTTDPKRVYDWLCEGGDVPRIAPREDLHR